MSENFYKSIAIVKRLIKGFCVIFGSFLIIYTIMAFIVPMADLTSKLLTLFFGVIITYVGVIKIKCHNIFLRVANYIICCGLVLSLTLFCVIVANSGSHLPADVSHTTIIVLGAKADGLSPSLSLKYRLDSAIKLLKVYPDLRVVVTGGKGIDEIATEASVQRTYLMEKGIDDERIFLEEKSSTTDENFAFAKPIIEKMGNNSIILVTNDFHILRAKIIAKINGYNDVYCMSAETPFWYYPLYYCREMAAYVKVLFSIL